MAKRIVIWTVFGLVFGYAASTWLGMHFTTWFFDPGNKAPVSCAPVIEQAFAKLLQIELWGTLVCTVLFLILGIFWERGRARKAPPSATVQPQGPR
jgi:hypothetical protein